MLKKRIQDRSASVAVVGVGYVGFPLVITLAKSGFHVLGFDISPEKVRKLNRGENESPDVTQEDFDMVRAKGNARFSHSPEDLAGADVYVICVPTPLDNYLQPDLSFVKSAAELVAKHKKNRALVVLESTTYPGTTEEVLVPILAPDPKALGKEVFLAYSPERIDPGNKNFTTHNTPKVVGGCTRRCTEVATEFYQSIIPSGVFSASNPRIAEMAKLLENTFRLVNISLVNELALLCDKMEIDIWEVIEAAKTKPYGFMAFYPGPGPGGHCIPVDPYYLTWKAREHRTSLGLIEKAEQIIHEMPEYVIKKTMRILNGEKKSMNGAKIALLGVTYKKDIADYRESPAVRIYEKLLALGSNVRVCDPEVPHFRNEHGQSFQTESLSQEVLNWADLAILTTDHSSFDANLILKHARKIYDTRNMFKERGEKVVRL